jgi:hypothetical protein
MNSIFVLKLQLLTDIAMANQNGMYSILTHPLTLRGDNPAAILVRIDCGCLKTIDELCMCFVHI